MKRILCAAFFLVLAGTAQAQFGGIDLGRALDIGKKVVKGAEASRDISTEEEIALGEAVTASFLGASPLHGDANLQRYVNRVGRWLALHCDRPALPGGSVIVSSGLLKRLGSESELAGVLAHEIAHVVKRHQITAIQSSAKGNLLTSIGKEVAADQIARRGGGAIAHQARTWAANAAADLIKDGVFLRPLDRSMEYEADEMAVIIATRSGYDPYGLAAALQMMAQHKGDADGASIFSTHPPAADRLAELERVLEPMERYASLPRNERRFGQVIGVLR
jgi:beta-barrel assembly-enhancing protease